MSCARVTSAQVVQNRHSSVQLGATRLSSVPHSRPLVNSKLARSASASVRRHSRAATVSVSCQASPYGLNNISALPYEPLALPATSAKSFDFLVLGSGIAGLTYALKVGCNHYRSHRLTVLHCLHVLFVANWLPALHSVASSCFRKMMLHCTAVLLCTDVMLLLHN